MKKDSQSAAENAQIIHDWLRMAISRDFTRAMSLPAEEGETPFAVKMAHFKEHIAHHGITTGINDFSQNFSSLSAGKQNTGPDLHPAHALYTGLLEVATGAYNLTAEEYHALQTSTATVHSGGEIRSFGFQHLAQDRPMDALADTDFKKFKSLVRQVREELKLPATLAVPGKLVSLLNSHSQRIDKSKNNTQSL